MNLETISYQLGLSSYVLERNIRDLSHEESLAGPEQGGNCLNWVLGDITRARNSALGMLTGKHPFPMEDFNAYDDRGGVPFSRQTALPLAELLRRFRSMQEPMVRTVSGLTPEALGQPAPFSPTGNPNETIGSLLVAFVFHESYHVGQTGLLRRVAGRPGAIKPAAEPVPAS